MDSFFVEQSLNVVLTMVILHAIGNDIKAKYINTWFVIYFGNIMLRIISDSHDELHSNIGLLCSSIFVICATLDPNK